MSVENQNQRQNTCTNGVTIKAKEMHCFVITDISSDSISCCVIMLNMSMLSDLKPATFATCDSCFLIPFHSQE